MNDRLTPEAQPSNERQPDGSPRIYVASLSDYNAGVLHGTWIGADLPAEVIHEGIAEMLAESPTTRRYGDIAEEWAIHDYENFGPVRLGEYEPVERVAAQARGIVAHGPAFAHWWDNDPPTETDDDELEALFEEQYIGEYETVEDYGRQLLDDLGINPDELPGVPDSIQPYVTVDVEAWVRDMQYGGEIHTVPSKRGVYVFRTN